MRRECENDGRRLRSYENSDRSLIVGMHYVARINQSYTHAAIARGDNVGIVELSLCSFDRGNISRDRSFGRVDLGLLLVEVLLRLKSLEPQRLESGKVLFKAHERGLVLGLLGFGLIDCGLEQARIDLGQHVAPLDVLTFGEEHLLQLPVDLGVNANSK